VIENITSILLLASVGAIAYLAYDAIRRTKKSSKSMVERREK
jgi:hypothetical protein